MKCICNYQLCHYDQGEQRQKLPAQGDLLSSTDWSREPRWDLAFFAHRSSVCSRLVVAADSSTDASQLRGHHISSPQAAAPGEMGRGLTHKLTICPRSVGEGRTPVPVTALTAQTVQWMSLFLQVSAQGNIKFHFYTGPLTEHTPWQNWGVWVSLP